MNLNLHFHIANVNVTVRDDKQLTAVMEELHLIKKQLKTIAMTNEELLSRLTGANTKIDKIIAEVQALKDTVNTTPDVPQNIVDAVNSLDAKLQAADDLNEDAATEPPVEPTEQP